MHVRLLDATMSLDKNAAIEASRTPFKRKQLTVFSPVVRESFNMHHGGRNYKIHKYNNINHKIFFLNVAVASTLQQPQETANLQRLAFNSRYPQ